MIPNRCHPIDFWRIVRALARLGYQDVSTRIMEIGIPDGNRQFQRFCRIFDYAERRYTLADDPYYRLMEPHAVRWATSKNRFRPDGLAWGKWHWTVDASLTLCGVPIVIGSERGSFLPNTDERIEKVNCKKCLLKMRGQP